LIRYQVALDYYASVKSAMTASIANLLLVSQ